ncbi:hypothetical protein VTK73DRAFT_9099 [Phialemonium thermophilum]|uniref:Heterokaryon incompatibility domain-containing protein n=1 Tax=Phialemonium thermophilum TaxID=223376 RepID=A0ABR3XME9_9PEZI
MRLARHWLSTCRNGHHCGKDHDMAPLLPTRTVEVNPEDGGPPRLHISAAGERACYVTLSYCWGDQNKIAFLKTKRNNLAQHVQALPGNMHKTLQDAIQATKDLGFRYLWIDALCIIQDDPLGTGKEIGKMGDIYRSTSLTLAAANGQDVTAGLFVPRSSLLHRPCFLTLDITGRRHRAFIYRFPFESIIALETRLWVLQEQILSPRTLVFRTDHMEWRCSDGSIHESIPSGHISKRPHTNIDELQSFVAQSRSGSQRMFPFNEWYRAVSALSTRRATYITDQLPALAGVASVLEDVCGLQDRKRYVAGLWVDDIYAGLVWVRKRISSISGNVARMDAASSFIAPTWSWAAKPVGLVTFFATSLDDTARKLRVFRRLATIERIHCEPEMPLVNPFGKVKPGAYLRVRGKLKTAVIGHPTLEYHFELDLRALYARGNEPIAGIFDVTADSMSPRIVGLVTFDCAEDRNTLTEVQVMPFLRFPDNDSSWESPCSMICLALVGSGNQYRRVGIIGVFREPRIISRDPEVDKPVAIVDNSPGNIYWDDNVWDGIGESVIQIY